LLGPGGVAKASATIAANGASGAQQTAGAVAPSDVVLRKLPVESISRGRYQPRTTIRQEALEELASSIRAQGVVQPIVVRSVVGGRYELIAGERRWRASQLAGLTEIPAVVRDVPDEAALAMALIENIQREDLNPLEEAQALRRLQQEFELTHQQVADAVGRSRAAVTNLLRLLDLGEPVQAMLVDGRLEMGHARALLALPAELQQEAAQQVQLQGLSVRETEDLARRLQQGPTPSGGGGGEIDPNIRALQDDLSQRLGAKIAIQHSASGKGRVVIQYHSLDELDGILAHIK
jgi:ParB family chromosome partitioning protein